MQYYCRKGASDGHWLLFLLPCCLFSSIIHSENSIHRILFIASTLLTIFNLCKDKIFQSSYKFIIYPLSAGLPIWYLQQHSQWNLSASFCVCLASLYCCEYLHGTLLQRCPQSFSQGEAYLIAQGTVLFLVGCMHSVMSEMNAVLFVDDYVKCLQVLLFGTFILVASLHLLPSLRSGMTFFIFIISLSAFMFLLWQRYLRTNIFAWLLTFCFHSIKRVYLIAFWFILTVASILFVSYINLQSSVYATTITRKYFHVIINAVFIPGILLDLELLRLASCVALTAFVVLEMFRLIEFPVVGAFVEDSFQVFLDSKDSGLLILTHIYLLIGCSCPLWLSWVQSENYHMSLLSGVISVGFGDTAAAVGGKLLGRHRWKGSERTYEGTLCAIVIQLLASAVFLQWGHEVSKYNVSLVVVAVFLVSILEAKTSQVDNLVLPLFMYCLLSWVR